MEKKCIVFVLTEDSAGKEKPPMLWDVLFCPALNWCARFLAEQDAGRFFIIADASYHEEALSCLPAEIPCVAAAPDSSEQELALFAQGFPVMTFREAMLPVAGELFPFHSREELAPLQERAKEEVAARHQRQGVCIIDPARSYIDPRASIGAGTVILPGTIVQGAVTIGSSCQIGPDALLRDSQIGDGSSVNASQVYESVLGQHVQVGPYAHIRPHCQVGDGDKVGAFVEIKNAVLGSDTKLSHLTYVGDAEVGARVNFGCGTITSNYDGFKKYKTSIGNDVFIGCNTNLIAPVSIEDGAYIAAGTTLTRDVEADSLAIGRVRQENKAGWAKRRRALFGKSR